MGQSWGASFMDPGPGAQGGVRPTPGGRWEEAGLLTPTLLPPGPSREPGLQAAQTENVRSSRVWGGNRPRVGSRLAQNNMARGWHCAASLVLQGWKLRQHLCGLLSSCWAAPKWSACGSKVVLTAH